MEIFLGGRDTFDVVFSQYSAELAIRCLGIRYECNQGGSFVGLGGLFAGLRACIC